MQPVRHLLSVCSGGCCVLPPGHGQLLDLDSILAYHILVQHKGHRGVGGDVMDLASLYRDLCI
jgi:hypothetical protein